MLLMLRDGASRLLSMRVRYLILLIGEERAQASVSKDFRSLLVLFRSSLLGERIMRIRYHPFDGAGVKPLFTSPEHHSRRRAMTKRRFRVGRAIIGFREAIALVQEAFYGSGGERLFLHARDLAWRPR